MLHQGIKREVPRRAGKFQKSFRRQGVGKSSAEATAGRAPAMVFQHRTQKNVPTTARLAREFSGLRRCWSAPGRRMNSNKSRAILPGQLTATIHGTEEDLLQHANLVAICARKPPPDFQPVSHWRGSLPVHAARRFLIRDTDSRSTSVARLPSNVSSARCPYQNFLTPRCRWN